ncbi:cadmium resistance transporter, partial [Staphylococcus epidermidis]|uniref:cadmium resistance transporter n=1 Tax=Staphylococcus epidermidis TaxID=1282 RepID=UPI0016425BF5
FFPTPLHLLLILLIFFPTPNTTKQYPHIYIPQYIPSLPFILVTLFFPFLLNYLPQKSILPLLRLIPIYLRIKV